MDIFPVEYNGTSGLGEPAYKGLTIRYYYNEYAFSIFIVGSTSDTISNGSLITTLPFSVPFPMQAGNIWSTVNEFLLTPQSDGTTKVYANIEFSSGYAVRCTIGGAVYK